MDDAEKRQLANKRSKDHYNNNKGIYKNYYQTNKAKISEYQKNRRENNKKDRKYMFLKITNEQIPELNKIFGEQHNIEEILKNYLV